MKIERNDRKKVFVKDVDYSTVVQINDQYYMPINKESFELFGKPFIYPFINLESGEVNFLSPMEEVLEVNAKLVID